MFGSLDVSYWKLTDEGSISQLARMAVTTFEQIGETAVKSIDAYISYM